MTTSVRRLIVLMVACSLTAPFTITTRGAGLQSGRPDPGVPTALEEALIEHMCRALQPVGVPETDAYRDCLGARLASLRADFGRDLGRLSGADRRTLDSVCSRIRETRGRDAYLECLTAQLTSIRDRRSRANQTPPSEAALPSSSVSTSSADPASAAPLRSWRLTGIWIGAGLVTMFAAAGGVLLAVKALRARPKCRACGMAVPDSGDLCPKCRHEAAEALRRAAAERADQQRAQAEEARRRREQAEEARRRREQEEEQRRRREQEEEEHRQKARQDEEACLRQQEEARRREQEEAGQRSQAAVVSEETFDPYDVLGVSRDASKEAIRAAYEEAKQKLDPELVSFLGPEVQAHFKVKAQAVERAYQMLMEWGNTTFRAKANGAGDRT